MKAIYFPPEMEIIEFSAEDVISASCTYHGGELPDDGKPWSPLKPVS